MSGVLVTQRRLYVNINCRNVDERKRRINGYGKSYYSKEKK